QPAGRARRRSGRRDRQPARPFPGRGAEGAADQLTARREGPLMRIVILDSFAADQGDDAMWTDLRALGELVVHARSDDGDVVARSAGAGAALTNKVSFSAATFAALPDLRYVGVLATGTNVVDLAAARAAGVAVTNVPSYAAASVAQHVLALVLHFSQDVAGHGAAVKAGAWAGAPRVCFFPRAP